MVKHSFAHCPVAGIQVADQARVEVVAEAARPATTRSRLVYALHVGGLLHLRDAGFIDALGRADLVYADGTAVVLLAKVAGAKRIERAATTDIGIPVLNRLGDELGRPVRVALIGGPVGLAESAGAALEQACRAEAVLTTTGYFEDGAGLLRSLRECEPDVILVGMGMPREAKWTAAHHADFPPAVVLTCGGWFGFLAGVESRAPVLMQRCGLEWVYRLRQDYRRLFLRYSLGAVVSLRLIPEQLRQRRASR